jgi:peptide/nickel transport system substrate-binding protein
LRSSPFTAARRRSRDGLSIVAILLVSACSDNTRAGSDTGGTMVIVTTADADILFPPLVTSALGRPVTELIYDYLAEVGTDMNTIGDKGFRPQLAKSWRWSPDSLSIAFRIDSAARWHDGTPVRADDVRFTYSVYTDTTVASATAGQIADIDSVTAPDSLTAVFWFHKRGPLQFFDATNQMQIVPRHVFGRVPRDSLRQFASVTTPVGSGRFRFVRWTRGSSLELGPDSTNYRSRPRLGRVIWSIVPSAVTATTKLLGGEADLYEAMRPENVRDVLSHPEIRLVSAPGTDYGFLEFNMRDPVQHDLPHPLFRSLQLRRALSMGVDRASIVASVFDSLASVAIGPTVRVFPTTDTTIVGIQYSPAAAARLLDSLGWRSTGADPIRRRNGRELRFALLVSSSSLSKKKMAVLLQEQLRKIGVRVDIDAMDRATFEARLRARDFDAAVWSWHLGSSAGVIRETWTTAAARPPSGLNYGSYSNPTFDAYVDSATSAMDVATSRGYYTLAYRTAIADAPAIWLYEPRMVLGIHRRIKPAAIRSDAWWYSLGDWSIPLNEQIPRDRARSRK